MQDLLTYALEAIALTYSFFLSIQFIAGIPTMSRCKNVPGQLDLFDQLFNQPESVSKPEPELDLDPNVVTSLTQLWQRPTFTDSIVPFRRPLKRLGIRQLRLIARDRGLKRYSQYTKPQLLEYLQAS